MSQCPVAQLFVYRRSLTCRFECNGSTCCGGTTSAGLDDYSMCDIACPPDKIRFTAEPNAGCVIGKVRRGDMFPHQGACCEADRNVYYVGTVRGMLDFARAVAAPNPVVVGNRRALRELLATSGISSRRS